VGLLAGALAGFVVADLNLPSLVSYLGDRTYLVPALAALGALLWLTPARRLVLGAVALLGLLWLAVAFTPVTSWLADGLVRRDRVEAADAVFVFASRMQEDGDPTPDAMSRLLKGVELVAAGHAPRLVVSEVPPPAGAYAPLARAWVAAFAGRGEVVSVGRIRNTREEAAAVARLFRERGWTRVLAVTSPTHTRRAAAALEREGLRVFSVPSAETGFDLERLHWPGDRRKAFAAIAHERIGLLVYRRRGWIE
jgi:uncharacterized SAM-binding protein YcdF (DUF218 family)